MGWDGSGVRIMLVGGKFFSILFLAVAVVLYVDVD
jgi:hypothetical protein